MGVVILAFLAGVLVALPPVGPLTLLLYRRALVRQFGLALAIAGAAALSDGLYAALAAFGYQELVQMWPTAAQVLRWGGVVVIALLGLRFALVPPDTTEALRSEESGRSAGQELLGAVGLALLNPSALITWTIAVDVVRALVGSPDGLATWQRFAVPVAVASGAFAWFAGLLYVWRRWLGPPDPKVAQALIRGIGLVLLVTAVVYGLRAAGR